MEKIYCERLTISLKKEYLDKIREYCNNQFVDMPISAFIRRCVTFYMYNNPILSTPKISNNKGDLNGQKTNSKLFLGR